MATISSVQAQFVYYEGFTGTTAPGWEYATDAFGTNPGPRLTAGTAPGTSDPEYVSGASEIDADGLGWMRLATVTGNQANAVALDTAIPSAGNSIKIGFDFTMWKPSTSTPADGITVFLWDASVTFDPGAFGGSLGYAQKTGIPGLAGAYVGVGLDVYGNYSNDQEGRQGAVNLDPNSGNYLAEIDMPNPLIPGQIAVRGPDDAGNGNGNYYYLGGTGGNNFTSDIDGNTTWDDPITSLSSGLLTFNGYADRPDQDATDYRYFEMELTSDDELIVRLQAGFTGTLTELFTLDLSDGYFDRPDQLRIGFAAATGGALNVHEIRNLSIETSGGNNSFYWDNSFGDQLWTTATNWDPDDTVPADYSHVVFSDGFTDTLTDHTVTVNGGSDKILHSITFTGETSYTLDPNTSESFVMDTNTSSGVSYINLLNNPDGNADQTINVDIEMNNDLKIQNLVTQSLTISGDIDNKGNDLYTNSHGNTLLSGVISDSSGAGDLIKQGIGTTRLTGNNSYEGNTTINRGILQIEHNNALGNTGADTAVAAGASLALANNITTPTGESVTVTGAGAGSKGAIFNASGTNTLGGFVGLTGNTTIGAQAGTLTFSNANTLNAAGYSLTLNPLSSSSLIFNRDIYDSTGTSNLIKNGDGTVILNANNNYSGTTTINKGILEIRNSGALGDTANNTVINSGGTLALSGGITVSSGETYTATGSGASGKAAIWSESSTNTLSGAVAMTGSGASFGAGSGAQLNMNGIISGSGNATLKGNGTVVYAASNTYTGGTFINSGTLRTNIANSIANNSDVVVSSGAVYNLNSFSDTIGSLAGAGNVNLGSATLTAGGNNVNTTYSGIMSGAGNFTKSGTGVLTFSGQNTFSGTLTVGNGTVELGTDNAFSNSMDVTLNNGGVLKTSGYSDTMDILTLAAGTGGNASINFNSQNGGLLTFANINSTLSGNLTVSNWIGTPLTTSSASTNTALFVNQGSITTAMTNLANATTFAGWGASGWKSVTGGYELVPTLSGFYRWDDNNGTDSWGAGTGTPWVGNTAPPNNTAGTRVYFGDDASNEAHTVSITRDDRTRNRTVGTMVIAGTGNRAYDITGSRTNRNHILYFDATGTANSYLIVGGTNNNTIGTGGMVTINLNDNLVINNNSSGSAGLTIGSLTGTRQVETDGFNITATGSGTTIINNVISGAGSLTKSDTGTLQLNRVNTFSNGTTLQEGTLQIGNNAALGTGTFTIEGGTIQAFGAARTITNNLDINNLANNSFTVGGSNNLIFSGTQTVAMPTGSLNLTVNSGISATFDTNKDLSGTGALLKSGTGTLVLSGNDNNFSGGLTVNAGTVQSTATSNVVLGATTTGQNYLGSGNITVNTGGTLNLSVSGSNDISLAAGRTISNTGGTANFTGTGADADFNLNGTLSSIGGTTTVTVDDDFVMGTGSSIAVSGGTVNLNPGATFITTGTAASPAGINVTGTGTLNVNMAATTGTGDEFNLDPDDKITVNGSSANMNITGGTATSPITFNGDLSLINNGKLTVSAGTTYLNNNTNIDGGSAATAGTLVIKGNLNVDEPAISNSPNLTIDVSGTSTINAPNVGSSITDLGTLTKTGTGTTTINGTNVNNIEAAKIIIDQGSLQLGASDQIANTVNMTFQGGVFDTNGNDEIVNSLTLTETSWIDLGAGDSILKFKSTSNSGTRTDGTLVIQAWSGSNTGGGTDQIIFGSTLSDTFLANVYWEDQDIMGARQLASGEIVPVPVPETGTLFTAMMLVGLIGWRIIRRSQRPE